MLLETERLALRAFVESDVDSSAWLLGEPRVMRYIEDGKPVSRADVERVVLPKVLAGGWWAAHEKASGAFIGWFELSAVSGGVAELGYRLHPDFWGRGYATEGASALVAWGFATGLERIVAYTMTVNTGSRRVMEKVGLKYVRTFHEEWPDYIEGAEHGDVEYALDLNR
ncbi:GNAT family N-acetyltransferase [Saccharothrix sp. ALI-22-I]|uniref:GNAT family N-acetyltransferase n=1 Tax=Saccharothrix sp. ALI-22-I TaxID=1933778 RepID=UPI00097BC5F2|nr:GNAT family N-acetyltransferase [Saccharothrix sp. ALI-22-I]ONI86138.1 GNAT family N-acetyltransferase [Saccharothrix sp. ALI-22-I]